MSLVDKKTNTTVQKANPIARWGKHEWKLTADQLYMFEEIGLTREWVDKKTTGSGKNKKTVKAHRGPIEFDFRFTLYKDFFTSIDIAAQIRRWNGRVGKVGGFYVGTTAFGAARKYRLVGLDISDVEQARGVITRCTIELHFKMTNSKVSARIKKPKKNKTVKKKSSAKKKKQTKKKTTKK